MKRKKKELEVDVVKIIIIIKMNDRCMHILPRNQQKTVGIKSIKDEESCKIMKLKSISNKIERNNFAKSSQKLGRFSCKSGLMFVYSFIEFLLVLL